MALARGMWGSLAAPVCSLGSSILLGEPAAWQGGSVGLPQDVGREPRSHINVAGSGGGPAPWTTGCFL